MSLTYQHALHNVVFEISTQINFVRNKLCDLQKEFESLKTTEASHTSSITSQDSAIAALKTTADNLKTEIDSIDTQLKALKDELSYTYSMVETKNDLVKSTRREVLQFCNDKTEHNGVAIKSRTNAPGADQQNLLAVDKREYNVDIGFQLDSIKSQTTIAGDITLKAANCIDIDHNGYYGRLSTGNGYGLSFASNGMQSSQALLGYGIQIEYTYGDSKNSITIKRASDTKQNRNTLQY
jgi:hypothetical protein